MHVVDFFFLVLIARYVCVEYLLHYVIFFPYIFREGYCH
jgi:hypothetical protein